MTDSIVPEGATTPEAKIDTSASALFGDLAKAYNSGDKAPLEKFSKGKELFALSDITAANTDGVIEQPQFIGEVWDGNEQGRVVVPLFEHGDLKSFKVTGFRFTTKPSVGLYTGNKAAIPSGPIGVEPVEATVQRFAGGHDIDRKYRDFSNEAFWSAYFANMAESYALETDAYVLAEILESATEIEAGDVPADLPVGLSYIVDGALSVIAAKATPTFALVSTDLYRDIVLSGDQNVLSYLNASIGLQGGQLEGFTIAPHADLAPGTVLVGSRKAAKVYELPGSPVRVEGLDVAKGGIDPALFGYAAVMIEHAEALALVSAPAAG